MRTGFEDHAVLVRTQLREGIGFVTHRHQLRRGKQRHFDAYQRPLVSSQWCEARIAQGCRNSIRAHIRAQSTMRHERTDTAAQRTIARERDKYRAGLIQPNVETRS